MVDFKEIANSFGITFLCGIIGIFFAIMFAYMNEAGIVVDAYVTSTTTISDIMFYVFFFWAILGLFLAFIRK